MSAPLDTAKAHGWKYDPMSAMFICDDFTYDAAMKLTGDFHDEGTKLAYALTILRVLNGMPLK